MGNRCRLWTAICHASSKWCGYPGLRGHNPLTSPITQRSRRTYNCGVKQPPHYLSRYKDKRRLCPSEKTTKGHRATPSMSDGGVLTSAYQTKSITEASNTGRTITIVISREQSYDDGSSVEVIIPVVCFLLVAFVVVLTVFVKKRRKRKAIKSKNVPHDLNILKPTEVAPVDESDSKQNHMLDEYPYAEIKESMTGINQASVPNTIKPHETDPNSLKPNEMVPVPVSDSTLYHILEESPYSEITGSGAENCRNHRASECQESLTRDNEDETYDHLERERSESKHGSEVDVAHPEIDNASEALLEDSCEVKEEKDYDHLELKEQSSNIEVFSEYSMTDDATRINKDETYDHLERNRSERRHGSEVDVAHPEIDNASEALLKDSCEVNTEKDYDHLELKEPSSNIEVFSEYNMTDDADYTDLSKRRRLKNPCSDYDHANLN
ncbi:hypothetical protein FSP39_018787 [Pinctada imbricata]|uniref:Uncharacterized protein n=1 Tax=Pinctada imbricata TaxID=66713 RepID=A0AA88YSW0_PINIB|nr:hypothetical protein FSP39_018787 [Pinctada imbricata]